jgi:zinc-ribbon domain
MAFCSKCGASLDPNSQFCPSCGGPVGGQTSASSSGAMPSSSGTSTSVASMQRPTGVTVLAVLAGIGGLVLLGFGAFAGALVGFLLPGLGTGITVVFVIFALIQFAIAYGFWVGASWAWWLGFIGAILDIISIIALNVIGLIIGIVMIYYLTRPHVKMWFHQG